MKVQNRGGRPDAPSRRLPSLSASPKILRRLLLGFAAAVIATACGSAAYLVHDARRSTYADARDELLGAQHLMRAHAQRTLDTARAFLTSIDAGIDSASRPGSNQSFADIMHMIGRLPGPNEMQPLIRLLDADGRMIDPSGRADAAHAGDHATALALRETAAGTIHLGLPTLSPVSGHGILPIALRAGANRFGVALLTAEVELEQFHRSYANLLITAPAVYGILRNDGRLLFQTPMPGRGLGWRIPGLDLAAVRARHGSIAVVEHDRFGGGPGRRLSGFAFLDGYPAMTYASFLHADIEARWLGTAVRTGALALFVTLVTASLTAAALALLSRYADEAERVRRALAEAEAASSAKSSFMARMSHEFRTPLNAILGFSEVIRDGYLGPLPTVYRGYGADIQQSGRRLLALVDQVLDIAGIEDGTVSLQATETDLQAMLDEAVDAVAAAARERGVEMRFLAAPRVRLLADPRMVSQAVLGVLSNAVKFSPRGGTVEVAVTSTDSGLRLTVEDEGPGIPDAVREDLFEPFGRHHAYVARDGQGLRLGLPVARSFMELHDGSIAIEARPGGGTRVVLAFPASRVRAGDA